MSNHPFRGIDSMLLFRLIHQTRPDFKLMASHLLQSIDPLKNIIIPVNTYESNKNARSSYKGVIEALRPSAMKAIVWGSSPLPRIQSIGNRERYCSTGNGNRQHLNSSDWQMFLLSLSIFMAPNQEYLISYDRSTHSYRAQNCLLNW